MRHPDGLFVFEKREQYVLDVMFSNLHVCVNATYLFDAMNV